MSNFEKLREFHEKFGIPMGGPGYIIPDDRVVIRIRVIMEEISEMIEAMSFKDYPAIGKELGDVLYTVYGTGLEYGLPMDEIFAEVHRSNMTKTGDRDRGGKIVKDEDFEPADIEGVLDVAFNDRELHYVTPWRNTDDDDVG